MLSRSVICSSYSDFHSSLWCLQLLLMDDSLPDAVVGLLVQVGKAMDGYPPYEDQPVSSLAKVLCGLRKFLEVPRQAIGDANTVVA